MLTNDFSKPKNRLLGSRIIPEMAQTIKILKVLPHFRDAKLVFRWTPLGNGKGEYERSNVAFHRACDDKGPLLVLVKLNNNGAIFGVSHATNNCL